MTRIRIKDLSDDVKINKKEMKKIIAGYSGADSSIYPHLQYYYQQYKRPLFRDPGFKLEEGE